MKKLISFAALFFSIAAFGQGLVSGQTVAGLSGTGSYFQWYQTSSSRASSNDSIQLLALGLTNQSVTGISWSQDVIGGPAVTLPAATFQSSPGVAASSAFWLANLAPGPYRFTATAKLSSGTTYTTKDSIYIVAVPAPRTVTGITISYTSGLPVIHYSFSDGSTQ